MKKTFVVGVKVWWRINHHGFDGEHTFVRREDVEGVVESIDEVGNWMFIRLAGHNSNVVWSARKARRRWRAFQSEGRDYLDIIYLSR